MPDTKPPRGRAVTERGMPIARVQRALRLVSVSDAGVSHWTLPTRGEVLIGRADECAIRLDDTSVSRNHAVLRVDERLSVVDLGSANGTWIGDERLEANRITALPESALFRVGGVTLLVQATSFERLRHLHSHDYFESRLEDECARLDGRDGEFALARLVCSAGAGPRMEQALSSTLRTMDIVATYAPDQYEVLFPDTSLDRARSICAELKAQITPGGISAKCVLALYPHDGRTSEVLLDSLTAQLRGTTSDAPGAAPAGALEQLTPLVARIAPGKISVLIFGETGVGKDVLAHIIHTLSPRRDRPFMALNCAALSESLLESELFGYQRGAFTGAVQAKPGLLESADGGTVFLDEIGEMPLSIQAKLLRVIERREVTRLGALKPRTIDVRFVAATHRDLDALVARGDFRQDLYFRLGGASLLVPPLRERVEEIPGLAALFLSQFASEAGRPSLRLSADALAVLKGYAWPGNVRELKNAIERAVLLSVGRDILPEHLPLERMGRTLPPRLQPSVSSSYPRVSSRGSPALPTLSSIAAETHPADDAPSHADPERERIVRALERCGGNQTHAAELLGISRGTLIHRIEKYGFARPRKLRGSGAG